MARVPVDQPYTITTEFGVKDSNAKFGYHSGIDYGVPLDRPIYAPTGGQLTNVKSTTGGNMVVIFDGTYYHRLMHNNSFSRSDGAVTEGQEVAKAGTTGLSFGVHCHWDINNEGYYPSSFAAFINPNVWLKGANMDPIKVLQSALNAARKENADLVRSNTILQSALNASRKQVKELQAASEYVEIPEPVYKKKA